MPPRYLGDLTLLMAALNLTGFAFVDFANAPAASWFCVGAMAFSFAVLWFFWKGRNWARWLVLITSVIAVLNLLALAQLSRVQQIVVLAEAPLGVFLLYWLNTNTVRSYFSAPRTG